MTKNENSIPDIKVNKSLAENGDAPGGNASGKGKAKAQKPLPAGLPYIAAGVIFFAAAMILPVYKLWGLLLAAILALAACFILNGKRKKQIAALPVPAPVKTRTEAVSALLDEGSETLLGLGAQIQNQKVAATVGSMAATLGKLADNLEHDPKDRGKIKTVAVHYVPMITDLVKNYINLERQGVGGSNISTSMADIEAGLENIDRSLKKYQDDMFEDDKMSISADIAVLQQLMDGNDSGVNKLNFDEILNEK